MRHIPLRKLLAKMLAEHAGAMHGERLDRGRTTLLRMTPGLRRGYIRRNGPKKWSPIKDWLTKKLGKKCWYTEAELIGAPLTIDHFRPIRFYWWLAFAAENYRVACAFANSPEHNELHGLAGGKGDAFPLLGPGRRATWTQQRRPEKPVILDPCDKRDCALVAFQADGRPVLNPAYASDPVALRRVEESKLLLNLDHPDFNSKREQLCNDIADDVGTYEDLPVGAASRAVIIKRLKGRLAPSAPFSSAAGYYLRLHRHLPWVDAILANV